MIAAFSHRNIVRIFLVMLWLFGLTGVAAGQTSVPPESVEAPQPGVAAPADGTGSYLDAARAGEVLREQTASLFERQPLEWGWQTIAYLPDWFFTQFSTFSAELLEQGRAIGAAGLIVVLIFLLTVIYGAFYRKRVFGRLERKLEPLMAMLPQQLVPYCHFVLKVVVAAIIPLVLYALQRLLLALSQSEAPWFLLAGHLLWLWLIGAVLIGMLREIFIAGQLEAPQAYGHTIFRLGRIALLAILLGAAIFRSAEAFNIRPDILALVHFVISITLAVVIFLLLLKKEALLSLIPERPYSSYRFFVSLISRFYYPLLLFSFTAALLWCVGFRQLGQVVLIKLWGTALAVVLIAVFYHHCTGWLKAWELDTGKSDEAAHLLIRSLKIILTYATVVLTVVVGLNMLGLLDPLRQFMSFPVFTVSEKIITFWIIIKAALTLLAFIFAAKMLQAYMDYKVYPAIGVDSGLGYALNTFLNYLLLAAGFLTALRVVGLDLRFLLVFAGAIGIGIGIGLQNMAANVISGFTIIFGGKVRKGDWIEIGSTTGMVTDINLGATNVRTRDNIEYLIPNANLISDTIVNYSLSSPHIRIALNVGVSYDADPEQVKQILLAAAEEEPMVEKAQPPAVRFIGFGDNSIDFQLLFWIDVKQTARRGVRSALYFSIFKRLGQHGIEIPFPQRDIHIKTAGAPGAENAPGPA